MGINQIFSYVIQILYKVESFWLSINTQRYIYEVYIYEVYFDYGYDFFD